MQSLSANEFMGYIIAACILMTAFFGPIRCSQHADTINRIIKKQCGNIDSRKSYDECKESLLK